MDRNAYGRRITRKITLSLSARRAWIEMIDLVDSPVAKEVALRKESVDRNMFVNAAPTDLHKSLSARRAWIEITYSDGVVSGSGGRSPQGERG